ncbi:MAG: ribonuclease P protein component [Rickettsiaceae bacterium]|nr:MAG: ribonuclease P protein component [Rickettsiaceae bacterium]
MLTSLKHQKHFDLVNKQGKKIYNQYFLLVLKHHQNKKLESPLRINFGMKVSKKVGNAVIRNKIKRRVRHLVRETSKQSLIIDRFSELDLIIIPKKGFEKFNFALTYSCFAKSILTAPI